MMKCYKHLKNGGEEINEVYLALQEINEIYLVPQEVNEISLVFQEISQPCHHLSNLFTMNWKKLHF